MSRAISARLAASALSASLLLLLAACNGGSSGHGSRSSDHSTSTGPSPSPTPTQTVPVAVPQSNMSKLGIPPSVAGKLNGEAPLNTRLASFPNHVYLAVEGDATSLDSHVVYDQANSTVGAGGAANLALVSGIVDYPVAEDGVEFAAPAKAGVIPGTASAIRLLQAIYGNVAVSGNNQFPDLGPFEDGQECPKAAIAPPHNPRLTTIAAVSYVCGPAGAQWVSEVVEFKDAKGHLWVVGNRYYYIDPSGKDVNSIVFATFRVTN